MGQGPVQFPQGPNQGGQPPQVTVQDLNNMEARLRRYTRNVVVGSTVATNVILGSGIGYLIWQHSDAQPVQQNQPTQVVQPAQPQKPADAQYADKVVEAQKGFKLEKVVLQHYFGAKSIEEVAIETAQRYKLATDKVLEDGTKVNIRMLYGNKQEDVAATVRKGDTLYNVVNRAVRKQVNKVALHNKLTVDNRAVVTVKYAQEKGLDIVKYLTESKKNHSPNDLVVVKMADGELGDSVRLGQKVTLVGYKVPAK